VGVKEKRRIKVAFLSLVVLGGVVRQYVKRRLSMGLEGVIKLRITFPVCGTC
jgi:hypothetical protein